MCTIPPPPPLPNPATAPLDESPPNTLKNSGFYELDFKPEICTWASEHPELRETCFKNNICIEKAPFRYKYKYLESISQIGPTCGIVALSMLLNKEVAPEELLNVAKSEGFTSNGEMFSCKQMVKLAEKACSLAKIENFNCMLKKGGLFSQDTIERLMNGAILLVPYDADCNHSPCLRNGHTAHWAIVCGVIIVNNLGGQYDSDTKNIYVLCKHGKSKYLAAWNLHDLAQSNNNLYEFSPKKEADDLIYILPEGGIGGENGLRDQFLIFEGF